MIYRAIILLLSATCQQLQQPVRIQGQQRLQQMPQSVLVRPQQVFQAMQPRNRVQASHQMQLMRQQLMRQQQQMTSQDFPVYIDVPIYVETVIDEANNRVYTYQINDDESRTLIRVDPRDNVVFKAPSTTSTTTSKTEAEPEIIYEDYPVYIDVPVYIETDYDPVTGTILSFEIKEDGSRNFLRSDNAKDVLFEYATSDESRIDSNQVDNIIYEDYPVYIDTPVYVPSELDQETNELTTYQ
ncbi:unnamed protein product, partial [Oikopleura dioica]